MNQRCFIIPPYMLRELARSDDASIAERAHRTLNHDDHVRAERAAATTQARAPKPGKQAPAPDDGTHPARTVCDAQHTMQLPGTPVRAEGQPAGADPSVDRAYQGLGDTWTFYHDVLQRDSIDDHGLALLGTVHYGKDYDNAFWDGSQMVFGDGDGEIFTDFTSSVDVIGHELTHGVTQFSAALVYDGQPGALNESMSDVFGVLVKQYALHQSADQADWLVGAELLAPGVKGRALRDMLHPGTAYDDPRLGKDPQPADMAHYVDTKQDNGGVHLNSGIPNRAFALAATTIGGNAWEGAGQVWYDVLTGPRIQARCDFATFAQLTVDAATERFGAGASQVSAVQEAWRTVGVLGDGAAGPTHKPKRRRRTTPHTGSDAPVLLERTGGVTGVVKQRETTLSQLPQTDAEHWSSLLEGPRLAELASQAPPVPDGFCYRVSAPEFDVDQTFGEPHLPEDVRELFQRTLRGE